jgi:CheY-like chemotaxis protein
MREGNDKAELVATRNKAVEGVGGGQSVSNDFNDIALVGFTQSEFATFETFFRLVSSRRARPFRATAQIANAKLVMLSTSDHADIDRTMAALTEHQKLVTVGVRRVADAWRHLERPINLNAVLVSVDAALNDAAGSQVPNGAQVGNGAAKPAAATPAVPMNGKPSAPITPSPLVRPSTVAVASVQPPERAQQSFASPIPARESPTVPIKTPAPVAPSVTAKQDNVTVFPTNAAPRIAREASVTPISAQPSRASAPQEAMTTGAARINILVVDDSDVALKFIHARLSAFGFNVDKCTSGEEALVRVADGNYQFVFLDVMMEGLDGYQTCKAIKGRKNSVSGKAPVVVMLTSRSGTIDKVRGTFAGCDAYLTKPLDETKMLKVLLKYDADIGNAISTLANPTMSMPRTVPREGSDPLAAAYATLSDRR